MIQVRLPDGSIGQFPDGMPDDAITKVIQQQFPPQGAAGAGAAATPTQPAPDPQQVKYKAALDTVRKNEYPQMNDQQWSEYSKQLLAPYSLQDQASNSQMLGFGDEIGAGIGALGNQVRKWTGLAPQQTLSDLVRGTNPAPDFGQAYGDLESLEQARRDLGKQNNGALGTAAEVLGGLSGLGPAGGGAAEPLWQTVLKSGATGGGLGAIQGFGSADENRAQSALVGGTAGAVVGGTIPIIGNAVSSATRNIGDFLAGNQAASTAGLDPKSASVLQSLLGADNSLSPEGIARIQSAGSEGMLADAGPSARQALDTAVQSSGQAGALARDQIGQRVLRDSAAINTALDNAFGSPEGIGTARATISADSAAARDMAYKAAYSAPIDYASAEGMHVEDLLGRVRPADIEAANTMMREEGVKSSQIMAQISDDGTVSFKKMPDVRQIDYITRALNDRADATNAMGKLGGQTSQGRITQNLSRDLRDALKGAVPEYSIALDTAADPIRRSQAILQGADFLNQSTTRDAASQQVARMTQPEKDALAQGIRAQLDDALANVARTAQDGDIPAREAMQTLKRLSTRAAREKVGIAIGDGRAQALFDELDRAAKSFELQASVANNSKTFARLNMNQQIKDLTSGGDVISTLAKGEPINAAKRFTQVLTGMTPDAIAGRKSDINLNIAKMLLSKGGAGIDTMQALQDLQRGMSGNNAIAGQLMGASKSFSAPGAMIADKLLQGN